MDRGRELYLCSAALWIYSALHSDHTDVILALEQYLAGIVPCLSGLELDGQDHDTILQFDTWSMSNEVNWCQSRFCNKNTHYQAL